MPVRGANATPMQAKPLELGAKLLCKWRDQGSKACEVIDRKQDEDSGEWRYYVHYEGFNRRLDEWVPLERFDLGSQTEDGKMTRTAKRKHEAEEHEEEGELDLATLKEHEEATKVKNINRVVMGRWRMETWYFSPFGKEYDGTDTLYVCEFDLNFFARREQLERYLTTKCKLFHPPGDEVYREQKKDHYVSIFEVDPKDQRVYCENLCLLAKLFLDHKTLYYDVEPFLFYIICEVDDAGAHMVGYFSKEKHSSEEYNLACILTLPCYQRKGYGKLMIAFSYEMSRREGTVWLAALSLSLSLALGSSLSLSPYSSLHYTTHPHSSTHYTRHPPPLTHIPLSLCSPTSSLSLVSFCQASSARPSGPSPIWASSHTARTGCTRSSTSSPCTEVQQQQQ